MKTKSITSAVQSIRTWLHRIVLRYFPVVWRAVQRDLVRAKMTNDQWQRLASDMLSTYREGKDFIVTQERVECWRQEWSKLSGINYEDVH